MNCFVQFVNNVPYFTPSDIPLLTFLYELHTWENGYNESFNVKLRDEVLNREIFYTLREAQVIIERWRQEYNTFRPHSSLGYRPPAPEALLRPSDMTIEPCLISEKLDRQIVQRLT